MRSVGLWLQQPWRPLPQPLATLQLQLAALRLCHGGTMNTLSGLMAWPCSSITLVPLQTCMRQCWRITKLPLSLQHEDHGALAS